MRRILVACTILVTLPFQAFADDFIKRGSEAERVGDFDLAIACFTAYIRDNPEDALGYRLRGDTYKYKNEYDKALKDYTDAIRLKPTYAAVYRNRGEVYKYKKEYDKAIKDLSEAVRLNFTDAFAYNDRGLIYQYKKEYDKAIKDFAEAIRLDPEYEDGYANFAWLLATCPKESVRDGNKAVELAKKACGLSRLKNDTHLAALAAAYAEAGDFKEAVKWQQKAINIGGKEAEKNRQRLKLYENSKPYREKEQ